MRNAVLIGPAGLWLGLYFLVPRFSDALNLRIVIGSGLLAGLSLLIAAIAWRDRRPGFFSTRRMLALFFACHGVTHLLRVPLAILAPATIEADGQIASGWYAVHVFVLYTQILLAGMALFALVRERIEEKYRIESETDALTAVLNRRAFMARLGEALERRQPGALALLDLDHFKRINDSHGHPAGDGVLVAFSAAVRDGLPEGAVFGRIGGEEFAVWLSHCDGEAALGLCERIRRLTEALCIPTATGTVRPTVSIGLCSDIAAGATVEAAIAVADHALYLSKHNGRNRVTMTPLHDGLETVKRSLSAATDAAAPSSSALKAG